MKTVSWVRCPGGKRGFESEHEAEKALGRSRAKHGRRAAKEGTRRGMHVENRFYYHDECGMYHLTSQSRRTYHSYAA